MVRPRFTRVGGSVLRRRGLGDAYNSSVAVLVGGDLGDPSREVHVLLGRPFDDVFGALVVAVDGVVGDQLEVDVPTPAC